MIKEIYERRSIRKFSGEEISNDDIKEVIKAGMNAPSARNKMPWEFIVVKDREKIDNIIKINPYAAMLKDASCGIVVCGRELSEFWIEDLSAATQNILLEATSKKLGTCWIGIRSKDDIENELKNLLKVPSDVRIFSIVALGISEEEKEANDKFDDEKIQFDGREK